MPFAFNFASNMLLGRSDALCKGGVVQVTATKLSNVNSSTPTPATSSSNSLRHRDGGSNKTSPAHAGTATTDHR